MKRLPERFEKECLEPAGIEWDKLTDGYIKLGGSIVGRQLPNLYVSPYEIAARGLEASECVYMNNKENANMMFLNRDTPITNDDFLTCIFEAIREIYKAIREVYK